jgi:inward rectifier potassium channel
MRPAAALTGGPAAASPGGPAPATTGAGDGNLPPLNVIGLRGTPFRDVYYRALRLSWAQFLAMGAGLFLAINAAFALLYMVQPAGISDLPSGSFLDAFFFSVQTLATIGYGRWAPVSIYANLVVTAETLVGASALALFAGLAFARFARPTAQVRFSRHMVVAKFDGARMLMVRLANERGNQILEANVSLSILRDERTVEGHYIRRLHDLTLVRSRSPAFRMSFLVMHKLDEHSPLRACTPESLAGEDVEIVAIVTGLDDTTLQLVHARHSYTGSDILFGRRFADLFGYTPDGQRVMDYRRFHETEPEE